MKNNILFVCKYNRFRSKVAEFLFNKYNKNKSIRAKSAGIIRGNPVDLKQKNICRKFGIIIENPTRSLSTKLLKWQDTVVIVADDVPASIFKDNKKYGKKVLVWNVNDAMIDDRREVRKIIINIDKRVKDFTIKQNEQ